MNRLTITLDDDLYAMARSHAVTRNMSLSKAISDLIKTRQTPKREQPPHFSRQSNPESQEVHPETGMPIFHCEPSFTMNDLQRALDDDDVRIMESLGFSEKEISVSLQP